MPFAEGRIVWSLEEVDYVCTPPLSDNMKKFLHRVHQETSKLNPPHIHAGVLEEPDREEKLQLQYQSQVEKARLDNISEKQRLVKMRNIQRKQAADLLATFTSIGNQTKDDKKDDKNTQAADVPAMPEAR